MSDSRRRKILLADYDPRSVQRILALLVTVGYQIEVVPDGESAARMLHRVGPALLLVQDLLPKKSGFEVCRELKATAAGRRVPIVVIASPRKGLKQELLMAGCDGHLAKPFTDRALRAKVAELAGTAPNDRGRGTGAARSRPTPVASSRRPATVAVRPAGSDGPTAIPVQFDEAELSLRLDDLLAGDPVPESTAIPVRGRQAAVDGSPADDAGRTVRRKRRTVPTAVPH